MLGKQTEHVVLVPRLALPHFSFLLESSPLAIFSPLLLDDEAPLLSLFSPLLLGEGFSLFDEYADHMSDARSRSTSAGGKYYSCGDLFEVPQTFLLPALCCQSRYERRHNVMHSTRHHDDVPMFLSNRRLSSYDNDPTSKQPNIQDELDC
jgi:hypothetical protein